jgi:pyruvate formate lyase activating enzyme
MDEERHRRFTGVSNRLILANLAKLSAETEKLRIRFPVIPTVTDDRENIARMIEFLRGIRFRQIDLLPYHPLGRGKAAQLGREDRMAGIASPSDDRMEQVRQQFAEAGFAVQVGG